MSRPALAPLPALSVADFAGSVPYAFALTLLAGLATGIGAVIALVTKKLDPRFLATALGFSAGVMLWVSMVELLPTATEYMGAGLGAERGRWAAVGGFFAGVLLIGIIDRLVPETANPHEIPQGDAEAVRRMRLMRTGLFTAGALAVHNFPEGFATFVTALQEPQVGVAVAVAIAIHNVPEGIAVSVPIYYATGSRAKAFGYSFTSGLAEPAGALLGYVLWAPYLNDTMLGFVLASVAGVMVFISLDELLPTAREYDEHHRAVYGLIAGMVVMAVSLLLLT